MKVIKIINLVKLDSFELSNSLYYIGSKVDRPNNLFIWVSTHLDRCSYHYNYRDFSYFI